MIKETEKKPTTPILNPDTSLEVKKNVFISVLPGLSEEFRRTFFDIIVCKSSSKKPTPLNLSLCTLQIKFHHS